MLKINKVICNLMNNYIYLLLLFFLLRYACVVWMRIAVGATKRGRLCHVHIRVCQATPAAIGSTLCIRPRYYILLGWKRWEWSPICIQLGPSPGGGGYFIKFSVPWYSTRKKKWTQSDLSFCKTEESTNLKLMEKGVNWIENEGKIDTKCLKSVK